MREVTIICRDCGHHWRTTLYTPAETEQRRRQGYSMGQPFCERCHSLNCRVD